MHIKKGFIIRQIGQEYMVVAIGQASNEFSGMIRLNSTGAFIWNELLNDTTKENIITKMLESFEDIDECTAKNDLEEFLETIKVAIEP